MAPILKKPAAAVARARMRQVFAKAEQDIIDEITRKRLAGYVDYAEVASLERVQQILTDMQDKVGEYMPKYIEKIFYDATEKDAHGYANARTLTSTQINVEQQLVNNLMGTLMEAESVAFESAKQALLVGQTVENIFRESTLHHVLEQQATGLSWKTASKNMQIDLQQSGITAFTDKAGRNWSLTDYCDMATRTTARQAEVAAALTADDWDLWQIAAIGSTCKLCATYEGRVYSKSGTNPDYPPLWQAFGKIDINGGNDLANTYLNIHPNCLHSLIKYTTMGKTDEQIQKDKDFSSFEKRPANVDYRTKKQREAYREKEKNRAKLLSDRNQWKRYRDAFGDDIPDFESFRRNKVNGTAKYQKWESEYKSFRAKGAEIGKEMGLPDISENIEAQTKLYQKYGGLQNMMLNGTPEDITKWSELQNITKLGEADIAKKFAEESKNWEALLKNQTDTSLKSLTDQIYKVATQEELSALRVWSGESYADINRYLRFGTNTGAQIKQYAKQLENVLNKTSVPKQIFVKRGTGTREIFRDMPSDWKTNPEALIGKTFTDNGFVATTPLTTGGFSGAGETQAELFIRVPEGTKGAFIKGFAKNPDEAEFLIQRGYTYRIVNAEYRANPLFPDEKDLKVWVEVVLGE